MNNLKPVSRWTFARYDPTLNGTDVAWIRSHWRRQLVLKGIQDVEEARLVVTSGPATLVVSNNGRRHLGGAKSSIAALPAVVEKVGHKFDVHSAGGIRFGQDVLNALALGARVTYIDIDHPILYGLGAMGEESVTRARQIQQKVHELSAAFCGQKDVAEILGNILPRGRETGSRASQFAGV